MSVRLHGNFEGSKALSAFHEKAGECQVFSFILSLFSFFFFVSSSASCSHSAKPPLSPPFHPHSLLSDCRSVQGGCT